MKEEGGENERFLIVIGREYGSGGRRIGKMLADELGVSYYDKKLLNEAAAKLGYRLDVFADKDERRPSLMRSILSFAYGAPLASIGDGPMSHERIYETQSRVIKDICSRESCVIVGRTADYVMRDHPRMISVFIHAPIDHRVKAVLTRDETRSEKEARDLAEKHDHARQSYYNYYTNREGWGKASNYTLTFDSSRISDQAILSAVKDMLNLRGEE